MKNMENLEGDRLKDKPKNDQRKVENKKIMLMRIIMKKYQWSNNMGRAIKTNHIQHILNKTNHIQHILKSPIKQMCESLPHARVAVMNILW